MLTEPYEKNHDFFPRKSAGLFVSLHTNFYLILVITFACCVLYWIMKTAYPCGLIIDWHERKALLKSAGDKSNFLFLDLLLIFLRLLLRRFRLSWLFIFISQVDYLSNRAKCYDCAN